MTENTMTMVFTRGDDTAATLDVGDGEANDNEDDGKEEEVVEEEECNDDK